MNDPVPVPFPIPNDPSIILWLFFWFAIAVTVAYAFALLYHWIRYAHMYPLVWVMLPIYLIGVVILIGAMVSSIAAV